MAIWARRDLDGLVHHSDRGGQYLAIRYTERLGEQGAVNSVGSKGDSYDNALAETIIGLYKTELIRRRGLWKGLDDVEYSTLEWVDWFNHRRLLEPIGDVPSRRVRGRLLEQGGLRETCDTQRSEPPMNPARFSRAGVRDALAGQDREARGRSKAYRRLSRIRDERLQGEHPDRKDERGARR
jgi:hypothetical protein